MWVMIEGRIIDVSRGSESFDLAANLLDHHIDLVTVLHIEVLGGGVFMESLAVEEESHIVHVQLYLHTLTLCLWQ